MKLQSVFVITGFYFFFHSSSTLWNEIWIMILRAQYQAIEKFTVLKNEQNHRVSAENHSVFIFPSISDDFVR